MTPSVLIFFFAILVRVGRDTAGDDTVHSRQNEESGNGSYCWVLTAPPSFLMFLLCSTKTTTSLSFFSCIHHIFYHDDYHDLCWTFCAVASDDQFSRRHTSSSSCMKDHQHSDDV